MQEMEYICLKARCMYLLMLPSDGVIYTVVHMDFMCNHRVGDLIQKWKSIPPFDGNIYTKKSYHDSLTKSTD
jgi:hypothetical protein